MAYAMWLFRPREMDKVELSDDSSELFTSRLLSDSYGVIEPTTLWPQLGLDDPHSEERFSVGQAQVRWRGRTLRLEVCEGDAVLMKSVVQIAAIFNQPLVLSTDDEAVVHNGFEVSAHLVMCQDFMKSKTVLGGCVNRLPISGRRILRAPYFQYADTFQVGEDIYGALDPAALDPGHQGKMVALYVIKPPTPRIDHRLVAPVATRALPVLPASLYSGVEPDGAGLAAHRTTRSAARRARCESSWVYSSPHRERPMQWCPRTGTRSALTPPCMDA
jgi:hypothetical protein